MTEFFPYEHLTWPEVDSLPRHTPLLLPLGNGYPLDRIVKGFGNPERVGLLPALPFGWRGSGLAVPPTVLGQVLKNLVTSLQDRGFTQVYVLVPPGVDAGLDRNWIASPRMVRTESPTLLPPNSERGKVILAPIGHTEQHGYHLPLSVDTVLIDHICRGVVQKVPGRAYALPVMPYGVSTHCTSFSGTVNVGGRAFEDFWLAVVDALVVRGFQEFYLLSGHGGNVSFLVNVVKYAGERFPHIFCATSWLYLSGPEGTAALQRYRQSPLGGMGHACELETSMFLFLQPELVHMERVVDEMNFITTPSYYMDWMEGGALIANPPWEDDTITGSYGTGSLGTAEKGKLWLDAAIAEKVGHVAEIQEQHRRRAERRLAAGLK